MKKVTITMLFSLVFSVLSVVGLSTDALALEVGDNGPCVVLTGLEANGTEADRCIREPQESAEGKRYTVLKFFSVTCSDCERLHQKFSQISSEFNHNASIHYIGIDRNAQDIRQYAKDKSASLEALGITVFLDNLRDAKASYGARATPTTIVVDRENEFEIIYKHVGMMSDRELGRFISAIQ